MTTHDTFTIMVVCTGNICRSAYAQSSLRRHLADLAGTVTVSSAGTQADHRHGVPPEVLSAARDTGHALDDHAPRILTDQMLFESDLVLGATREHRSAAIRLRPRTNRVAFTLREFVRLSTSLDMRAFAELQRADPLDAVPRLRRGVVFVAAQRGLAAAPPSAQADDIDDPFGGSSAAFNRATAEIDQVCASIERTLRAIVTQT